MPAKAGQIVIDITAGTKQFIVDMEQASGKIRQFGKEAHSSVTGVQAVSGALRVMEGNVTNNLRAAERWVASLPGVSAALKVAFPVVGAVAFGGIVTELGTKVRDFFKEMTEAPAKVSAAFRALNDPLRDTNDALAVSNARLENEIAKLEGLRQNNLKVALLEAVEAADKLAGSLNKDIGALQKLLEEKSPGMLQQLLGVAGFDGLDAELRGFQERVAKITSGARAAVPSIDNAHPGILSDDVLKNSTAVSQAAMSKGLADAFDSEIGKLQNRLRSAQMPGASLNPDGYVKALQDAIENLTSQRQSVGLQVTQSQLQGKKPDAEEAAERRRKAQEAINKALEVTAGLEADFARATENNADAMDRIDIAEREKLQQLQAENGLTAKNLDMVHQTYDTDRLTAYNRLMNETVNLHLNLSSVLKNVSTEEAAIAVYGPQFTEAAKQLEEHAKAAAEWAVKYNKITAQTASESLRHRVTMAGANGSASDPLGTLRNQQAIERADIEARYGQMLKADLSNLDRSNLIRQKGLDLQKLQNEMEERTAELRHKNLADFMREMQGQTKTAGDILYAAANAELDSLSNNLAKLATGQHKKTTFGKDIKSVGDTIVQSSMKAMLQKGLGALGKKAGIGKKQDGQSEPGAFWVQLAKDNPVGPNPLAGMMPSLPPALGKSGGGEILGGIGGFLGGLFGKGGAGGAATSVDSSIEFMAGGGDADPGHVYGVAEAGEAELISPKNSSRITPLSKLTGGGSPTYNIDARGADLGAENRVSRAIEASHSSAVTSAQRASAEQAKRTPKRSGR